MPSTPAAKRDTTLIALPRELAGVLKAKKVRRALRAARRNRVVPS